MKGITAILVGCFVYLIMALSPGYATICVVYPDEDTGPLSYEPDGNAVAFMWEDDDKDFGETGDYTLAFYEDRECEIEVAQIRIQNKCYHVLYPCEACAIFDSGTYYFCTVSEYSDDDDDDLDDGDSDEDTDEDDTTEPVEFTIDFGDVPAALGCACETTPYSARNNSPVSRLLKSLWRFTSDSLFSTSIAYAYLDFPGFIVVVARDARGYPAANVRITLGNYHNRCVLTTRSNGCDVATANPGSYQASTDVPAWFSPSPYIEIRPWFQTTALGVTLY